MLPVSAWAEPGAAANTGTDTAVFGQGVLLDTFGNWQVRRGLVDNTYLLIGESSGDGEGHFWLHCDQNNLITVAVPLLERPHDRVRSHAVTIHADTGPTRDEPHRV